MKRVISLLCCAAMLPFVFSGCQTKEAASSAAPQQNSSSAAVSGEASAERPLVPDFTLQANNGQQVSLSDYAGKVVVINFWASWCPPCKAEMPEFQRLQEAWKDSEDTVLLMLNQTDGQRETKEKADAYLSENEYDFLMLYDSGEVGYEIFGLEGIPATVVIDKQGRLANYVLSMTDYDTLQKMAEGAK